MRRNDGSLETVYHVTVLSNFARGYDKYSRTYNKSGIPESSFPDRFFVLRESELSIGVNKAGRLLDKLNLEGNDLIVLQSHLPSSSLHPNTGTGLGRFIQSDSLPIEAVYTLNRDSLELHPIKLEEAAARSLLLLNPTFGAFEELQPRTVSLLPLAQACQASCRFCFSAASVSADQVQDTLDIAHVQHVLRIGRERGAERVVITGGGEPGLLPHARLRKLVALSSSLYPKVVLISNGLFLAKLNSEVRQIRMAELAEAGLTTLAISRHHADCEINKGIMGLDTQTEKVLGVPTSFNKRLICVLQKGGVEDEKSLADYLQYAANHGVEEVCFKELYVSTTLESAYHEADANVWSYKNQVPLSLVTEFAQQHGFVEIGRLPWGAPIFSGEWNGSPIRIAAYTETSLFWERSNGVARSWNIMADGRCLVSLEDPNSEISFEGQYTPQHLELEAAR